MFNGFTNHRHHQRGGFIIQISYFRLLKKKTQSPELRERAKAVKMLRLSTKRLLGIASGDLPSPAFQIFPRFYHERVIDHYNNPRNVGSFDKNDPTVGTGLVGAPACGDVMKLQIKVDDKTGKVVDACFKTFGCGSAIASSSLGSFFFLFFSILDYFFPERSWAQFLISGTRE